MPRPLLPTPRWVYFMGTWVGTTTYFEQEMVVSGGVFYLSLQNTNLNHDPALSPTWWEPLTTPGPAGPPGAGADPGWFNADTYASLDPGNDDLWRNGGNFKDNTTALNACLLANLYTALHPGNTYSAGEAGGDFPTQGYGLSSPAVTRTFGGVMGRNSMLGYIQATAGNFRPVLTWQDGSSGNHNASANTIYWSGVRLDGGKSRAANYNNRVIGLDTVGYTADGSAHTANGAQFTVSDVVAWNAYIGARWGAMQYARVSDVRTLSCAIGHFHQTSNTRGGGVDMGDAFRDMYDKSADYSGHLFVAAPSFPFSSYALRNVTSKGNAGGGGTGKTLNNWLCLDFEPGYTGTEDYNHVRVTEGNSEYTLAGCYGLGGYDTLAAAAAASALNYKDAVLPTMDDPATTYTQRIYATDVQVGAYSSLELAKVECQSGDPCTSMILTGAGATIRLEDVLFPVQSRYCVRAFDSDAYTEIIGPLRQGRGGTFENVRIWPTGFRGGRAPKLGYPVEISGAALVLCGWGEMESVFGTSDFLRGLNASINAVAPWITGSGSVTADTTTDPALGGTVTRITFPASIGATSFARTAYLGGDASMKNYDGKASHALTQCMLYNPASTPLRLFVYYGNEFGDANNWFTYGHTPSLTANAYTDGNGTFYTPVSVTLWPKRWMRVLICALTTSDQALCFVPHTRTGSTQQVYMKTLGHYREENMIATEGLGYGVSRDRLNQAMARGLFHAT